MKTHNKIFLAVIICMTWGMLTQALTFWGGSLLGAPKDPSIILLVCGLSCSFTIFISQKFELFIRYPDAVTIPIVFVIQFFVYAIISFAIALVIYKNDKAIKEPVPPAEPTQD